MAQNEIRKSEAKFAEEMARTAQVFSQRRDAARTAVENSLNKSIFGRKSETVIGAKKSPSGSLFTWGGAILILAFIYAAIRLVQAVGTFF